MAITVLRALTWYFGGHSPVFTSRPRHSTGARTVTGSLRAVTRHQQNQKRAPSSVISTACLIAFMTAGFTVSKHPNSDLEVARAAVLELRSSVGDAGRSTFSAYYLEPSEEPMVEAELVKALAHMPKPIRCLADVLPTGFRVRASTILDESEVRFQRLTGSVEGRRFVDYISENYRCDSRQSRVMLRGAGPTQVVSLEILETLLADYQILAAVSSAAPDAAARSADACAVIVFGPTATISIETRDSPP